MAPTVGVVALWFLAKHWEEMAVCPFSLDGQLLNFHHSLNIL
jgi:hypothetical protein